MAITRKSPAPDYGVPPMWYSTVSGNYYRTQEQAAEDEVRVLQSPEYKAEQQRISDLASLKSQVLDQWKQLGVPSIGGGLSIDERAQGLAERLYANQITDLKNLGLTSTTRSVPDYGGDATSYIDEPASYLTYNGRQIGFLGDIGTAQNWQPTGYLQPGNLASWGSQGKGAVSYTVQKAPNGQVYFIPSWGSTSDLGSVAPLISLASIIPSPIQPFAAAANAAIAIDQGNVLGGLASLAGIPGVSEAAGAAGLGSAVSAVKAANQVSNLANAVESGNVLGALAAGANLTGTGGTQIGDTGVSVAQAIKTANIVNALDQGNVAPLIKALASEATKTGPNASDFEEGYFAPGGAGYVDTQAASQPTAQEEVVLQPDLQEAPVDFVQDIVAQPDLTDLGDFLREEEVVQDFAGPRIPQPSEVLDEFGPSQFDFAIPPVPRFPEVVNEFVAPDSGGDIVSEPVFEAEPVTQEELPEITIPTQEQQVPSIEELIKELEPYQAPAEPTPLELLKTDYDFKPDYTLFPEPTQPSLEDMGGAQGVQVQELPDVFTEEGAVDYDSIEPVTQEESPEMVITAPRPSEDEITEEAAADGWQGPMGPMDEATTQKYSDEFSKYLDFLQSGSPEADLSQYPVQDLGITEENWDSFNQNLLQMQEEGRLPTQWRPNEDGTFTYQDDDGSTLTIDQNGEVTGFTEAPAGNLPGETPAAGSEGAGQSGGAGGAGGGAGRAGQTGQTGGAGGAGGGAQQAAPKGVDLISLLGLMGAMSGGQRQQQPVQTPLADIKSFEEMYGELFGPKLKFSDGGSVDDLIALLRG